jgi:ankyrin repeat protein
MARRDRLAAACCLALAMFSATAAWAADGEATYRKLILGRHYAEAVALLARSAKSGNPLSQYRLAVMLRNGLGARRNDAAARDWLRKSAQAGNADAARLLQSLSSIVTSQNIPVPATAPGRTARVASLEKAKPRAAKSPGWLAIASARAFIGIAPGSLKAASVNERDGGGQTPLITAARAGNARLVAQLLAAGADVNAVDAEGWSAYLWSIKSGHADILRILIKGGADPGRKNRLGETGELIAAKACSIAMLDELANQAPNRLRASSVNAAGETSAHLLAQSCISQTPDARHFSIDERSAIDAQGRTPLWQALASRNAPLAALLLKDNALAVKIPDNAGVTPLHVAASRGQCGSASLLLAKGADPEATDSQGNTPLMLAAANAKIDCVKLLLALARDINQKNADGETVLTLAVKSQDAAITALVAEAGGAPTSRSISRDTPEKIVNRLGNPALKQALQ